MAEEKSELPLDFQVTAAQFVRNFAQWRESALRHPVYVTNHGRPTHVLSSIEQFERLTRFDEADGPSENALYGLADWVDEAIIVCDADENVIYSNRLAVALCGVRRDLREDVSLWEATPSLAGTLAEVHFRRTLTTRQASSVDMPSPFVEGGWLLLRCFPLRRMTVLMMKDITEDVARYRLADVKEGMLEAISMLDDVGYVRISPRGIVERADKTFCQWIGLGEDRIVGVRLIDLVARPRRVAFRELVEAGLEGGAPQLFETVFIPNRKGEIAVSGSLVSLHGAYGNEGAVLVFKRTS